METIQFDSGIREYRLEGLGVLRFHPGDPNLYARFLEAAQEISQVEKQLTQQAQALQAMGKGEETPVENAASTPDNGENPNETQDAGKQTVLVLQEADRQIKKILTRVFGGDNDFEKLFSGVSLLAVAGNGERVITNLFAALQPILSQGAATCLLGKKEAAKRKAAKRRAGTL